jgi:hypothetical protein
MRRTNKQILDSFWSRFTFVDMDKLAIDDFYEVRQNI